MFARASVPEKTYLSFWQEFPFKILHISTNSGARDYPDAYSAATNKKGLTQILSGTHGPWEPVAAGGMVWGGSSVGTWYARLDVGQGVYNSCVPTL